MGGLSRCSVGAGCLTVIPAVRAHSPPIDLLVTAGDGRNESNQSGQESFPTLTTDVVELLDHGSSQSLSSEKRNGEPTWPAAHDKTMQLRLHFGSLELRDQPQSVPGSESVS
jgi:hypothetical protein